MTDRPVGAASRARRWLTYVRERSPLQVLFPVALAQSLSASALVTGDFRAAGIAVSTVGVVALMVLMRLMDESKDAERDRIAHPGRPVPRGLLSEGEVRRAITVVGGALTALAAVVGLAVAPVAGAIYGAVVGFAFLMHRDFFIGRLAEGNAFTYAIAHQVIVIPIAIFSVSCVAPGEAFGERALWFALTALGASFVIEVSRKLDPDAHPVLRTYLREYGPGAAAAGIAAGLVVVAIGAHRIGVHAITWPFIGLVMCTLPLLVITPRRFRVVQGAAALLGVVHAVAPILRYAPVVIA
jgi:4-hydroxybenzoate polyprenyltransferase